MAPSNISTQPGTFHIHVDAQEMTRDFRDFCLNVIGFADTDFDGHPEGYRHFEPKTHFTLKLATRKEFDEAWEKLEATAQDGLKGYLEGEFIATDEEIPYREYDGSEVPFRLARRRLDENLDGSFRQTELHLTFRREGSHPGLMKKLLDAGLYGAYLPKADGSHLVLTAQGYSKDIKPLAGKIRDFVKSAGGLFACTLKEERAIRHRLFGIEVADLPEIVSEVSYAQPQLARTLAES